ncbi:MAG: hypothetical protein RJA25_776 [Bacteroidota bacterium]|jgi:hypothetical protein
MKKIFYAFLLFLQCSFAQNEEKAEKKLSFKPDFSINAIIPFHSGTNYLADAAKSNFALGIHLNFLKYNNFLLGMGFDYVNYSITDVSKGGDLGGRNLRSIYGRLGYRQSIIKKLEINPYVGMGYANLNSSKMRYGKQEGIDYRIGANINYKLNQHLAPFIGVCYLQSKFKVNGAAPEYVSYFDHSKMLQLIVGLNIN